MYNPFKTTSVKTIVENSLLAVFFTLGFCQLAPAQAFKQGSSIIIVGYGIGNLNKTLFKKYADKKYADKVGYTA